MQLIFEVLGPPHAKERARQGTTGRGKRRIWYTPPMTVAYESAVKTRAWAAFSAYTPNMRRCWPLDARYRLTVDAYFGDNRRRDIDNVVKSVSDALNGMCWADDSQVDELFVQRFVDRERPRTLVKVEVL